MHNLKNKKTTFRRKCDYCGVFFLLLLMIFSLLTMAACDPEEEPSGPDTTKNPRTEDRTPGFLEPGERDQVAFIMAESITSDSGADTYRGLQLIAAGNAECRYVENVLPSAASAIVERLIRAGYKVIFFDSPLFSEAALEIAEDNSETMFFLAGGETTLPNLVSINFREEEQSFLLGAVSSVLSQEDDIGLVAKYPENPEIAFTEAFTAGANYVNPSARVHSVELDFEQKDASIQTEQLIANYEPAILAIMAGGASASAMYEAREAGLVIVSTEADVKLPNPVNEPTEPNEGEDDPDESTAETESETTNETESETTPAPIPTAGTVPSWSPGATRPNEPQDDPNLFYDPVSAKVLLKRGEAFLYAYELFRSGELSEESISCGVKEELIVVEDYADEIDADLIASIDNVIDIIAKGDVTIPR